MLHILLALAVLSPSALETSPAAPPKAAESHGKIPWFQGTFDEALARAASEKKLVFVDFWTTWCGWCKKLDQDTYSDAAVVEAMGDVICLNIDAESAVGLPIAKRFPISGFPTMIVLEPDGALRDVLSGYFPPAGFRREMARIVANQDTLSALRTAVALDKTNVDKRWKYASRSMELGDAKVFDAEVAEIRKLDPEGKSLAMHFVAFRAVLRRVNELWQQNKAADAPALLQDLISREPYPEVQFRAWNVLGQIYGALVGTAKSPEEAQRYNLEARQAQITAWRVAPDRDAVGFGKQVLGEFYANQDKLNAEDKGFALEVGLRLQKLAPDDADALDLVACAHFLNGKKDEALTLVRRAIELDKSNAVFAKHLGEFGG